MAEGPRNERDRVPQLSADELLDAVYEFDAQGRLVYANDAAREVFGFPMDADVSTLRLDKTIVPEDRESSQRDIARIYAGETVRGERTFLRTDGSRFVGEIHSGPVVREGRVVGVRGVLRDITARREAEARLRESELRFKTLFDLSPQPIAVTKLASGTLIDVNRKFCELSGFDKEEVVGRPTWEVGLLSREERERFASSLTDSGEVRGLPMVFENRHGEKFDTLMFSRKLRLSGEDVLLTVVSDITDEKRLEAELLQARKMEAIGTLAGGVAHDFNNLLMVVGGIASVARLHLDREHPLDEPFRRIEEQVKSGASLTRQLLAFARSGKYDVVPSNLNKIVQRSASVFARTHKNLLVEVDCAPEAWSADVDKAQIEQMLLNLFVNAAHAMSGAGRLELATRNVTIDAASSGSGSPPAGRYVRISVMDSGTGMDEATQRRVFEPFFTTKTMGRGTGLGLASVYGIVKNHAGAIEVSSKLGMGTRFDVYLPASQADAARDPVSEAPPSSASGLVLLIDDEEAVADVTEAMLRELGYKVLVAHEGASALELFRAHADQIDAVLLDMVMPGMSGATVFEKLNEIRPEVPTLLASGYSLSEDVERTLRKRCQGFIQKPFGMDALGRRLEEVITGGKEGR